MNKKHYGVDKDWFCMSCKSLFDIPKKEQSKPIRYIRCIHCGSEDIQWDYEVCETKAKWKTADDIIKNVICELIEKPQKVPGNNSEREPGKIIILTSNDKILLITDDVLIKELSVKCSDSIVFAIYPRDLLNELDYVRFRKCNCIKRQKYDLATIWIKREKVLLNETNEK
ncbi:MAG: hypothetical protein PHD97_00640 [Bacteroidales bacterium]|nr:hypothetical protein [Bacteroidales bacterium]